MKSFNIKILMLIFGYLSITNGLAQGFDSTQIGKDYPYAFPILGKKAYSKGYKLPLPHSIMINSIWNRQNIVLENMELAFLPEGEPFDESQYIDFSDIIIFGPSTGRINTLSFRASTWLLPFLGLSVNYGEVWGEQVIRLEQPVNIESVTDIVGRYYGLDLLTVIPAGPVNVALNWAPSWTTNERLNEPVRVDVVSGRLIYNFPIGKKEDRYLGLWFGAQYQRLAATTEGKIGLEEAIDPSGDIQLGIDDWYNGLTDQQKRRYGDTIKNAFDNIFDSIVYYRFDKRLEEDFNLLFGAQYQFNRHWQVRGEYGAINSKQQLLLSFNYSFGL